MRESGRHTTYNLQPGSPAGAHLIIDTHIHVYGYPSFRDLSRHIRTMEDAIAFRTRYPDLYKALPEIADANAEEWRIHFHVPIFIGDYASFGSTQEMITEVLDLVKQREFTDQLEIETYTWDVLPAGMKQDLTASIAREYQWVLDGFA